MTEGTDKTVSAKKNNNNKKINTNLNMNQKFNNYIEVKCKKIEKKEQSTVFMLKVDADIPNSHLRLCNIAYKIL